jgi:hypothetical protein
LYGRLVNRLAFRPGLPATATRVMNFSRAATIC